MSSLETILSRSIPELRERYLERRRPVPKGLLEALEVDTRLGAHQLAKQIRGRYRSNRAEGQRLHTLLRFEIELWSQGYSLVAGVDEAGMAPLAGPVVAGAVILPKNYKLRGLNDSKKILDHETREELATQIKQDAICWSFGFAEVEEIDRINIYHAGLLAMQRAVQGLSCLPDFVLVDARKIPHCSTPQRGIIRGDALSASIAAASIIAKTTRDAHMLEISMRLLKKSGSVAILFGILLILSAGWFFLWTWSSALLRCVPCDCTYDLSAANSYCRWPAILNLLLDATFIGAIALFVLAWYQRRRARRTTA